MRRQFCALALAAASACWAQGPSRQVLGLPFGSELVPQQLCPLKESDRKRICWIDAPFRSQGTLLGHVHAPDQAARPVWAQHAFMKVLIGKGNLVRWIEAETFNPAEKVQIVQSVSMRFGTPVDVDLTRPDVSWAHWRSSEGSVSMRCSERSCWTRFLTPEQVRDDAAAAERKRNAEGKLPRAP
jgi:hypothetical protein